MMAQAHRLEMSLWSYSIHHPARVADALHHACTLRRYCATRFTESVNDALFGATGFCNVPPFTLPLVLKPIPTADIPVRADTFGVTLVSLFQSMAHAVPHVAAGGRIPHHAVDAIGRHGLTGDRAMHEQVRAPRPSLFTRCAASRTQPVRSAGPP
ncbi:hypothetical protein [Burkholderia sp. SRS-W-2-2016]|uniref:hypothetical protein n=1 Tax=Burkholderia sp. SRS-W-2-2016 TaxID=1926878 RepID=UPI00117F3968|nr:hypothetical protein [Burkholderia sp. SRS-W-2-2016]